jgi:acetyl esterase/lipase
MIRRRRAAAALSLVALASCATAPPPAPTPAPAAAAPPAAYQEDVIYGRVEGSALLADVAWPGGEGPYPAILSIHGGRWVGGHRRDASSIKVKEWAGHGFFAMSIDYRLARSSPAPACYQDLLCAIRWVRAHAAAYRVDPDRIFLIGQSAGGHLASLVATLGEGPYKRAGGWNEQSADVRAVISVCAPYELNTLSWGKLWAPIGENEEAARQQASPIRHVKSSSKPILILHSDDDKSVPVRQAIDMAAALKEAGAPHKFLHYTDKGHMGIVDYVVRESLAFIREVAP